MKTVIESLKEQLKIKEKEYITAKRQFFKLDEEIEDIKKAIDKLEKEEGVYFSHSVVNAPINATISNAGGINNVR
jgi:chromosome segregation ATPase